MSIVVIGAHLLAQQSFAKPLARESPPDPLRRNTQLSSAGGGSTCTDRLCSVQILLSSGRLNVEPHAAEEIERRQSGDGRR
jgi:hypothetical protein